MENKKVILLVEDEQPLIEAIKHKLELNDFSVASARTVAQAFNYLEELPAVDVIWLDHYLVGKENGLDFVARLKSEDSRWRHIPVFVVSNTATADKVSSYIGFGINKYYTKSDYRLEQIMGDIKKLLKTKE